MSFPLISVIVPTRNRRNLVAKLLTSLERQREARLPFEVIVVDDGSSDGTVAELRSIRLPFELHVIEQQSQGPARARNAGAVTLSWTEGGTLQQAPEIAGPWTDSLNQSNPQTFQSQGKSFFRIRP